MKSLFKNCALGLLMLASAGVDAQEKGKQGNLVEIFGREIATSVDEGAVWYEFTEGWMLPNAASYGRNSLAVDPVSDAIFRGETINPESAVSFGKNQKGEDVKWVALKHNEKERFEAKELRRGQLYLSVESDREFIGLLEASGNTMSLVNGMPHEGDHYDFGWSLVPFKLQKGKNEILLSPGRRQYMKARILVPHKPLQLTKRDLTLPSIIKGEREAVWGAVRIVNASESALKNLSVECVLESGEKLKVESPSVAALQVFKAPFQIPAPKVASDTKKINATLKLYKGRKVVDELEIQLNNHDALQHHERTFISGVDRSVQYYSVAPCSDVNLEKPAMVLSVHGASVEARNQSRAYRPKEWAHVVAPTNRRPYGFAWEDWGRLDALEVLADAEKRYDTDKNHTYLTGHSMGGHGTWYLGATYPDRFAAIAPCAGYADLLTYGKHDLKPAAAKESGSAEDLIKRSGNPTRTTDLARNYLHHGVYIHHGDADNVVPILEARKMRKLLGTFHNDFCHYEYPGGSHWFSNESVDWKPLFDYFQWHEVGASEEKDHIEFHTSSPGVSSSSNWVGIVQQEQSHNFSNVTITKSENNLITASTSNVAVLRIDLKKAGRTGEQILSLDGQELTAQANSDAQILLSKEKGTWKQIESMPSMAKNPARYGNFKSAFTNGVVFVYATRGNSQEDAWYLNKARYDAETFWYRGNASIELIKDVDFDPKDYQDRNVVLYGNASNNAAWKKLLKHSPVQVKKGRVEVGDKVYKGDDYGVYFVYPRKDSETASVGVVAGTGVQGMHSVFANQYFVSGSSFADLLILNGSSILNGLEGVELTGFFGNDWSVASGEFNKK